MKWISLIMMGLALSACSTPQQTTIFFSGHYTLKLDTNTLTGAKLFFLDGPSIKFSTSQSLSGLAITRELEELPPEFNLHDYPDYALGRKSSSSLPESIKMKFDNSANEIRGDYPTPKVITPKEGGRRIYLTCNDKSCLSFIVDQEIEDHILMLTGNGFPEENFLALIKGV